MSATPANSLKGQRSLFALLMHDRAARLGLIGVGMVLIAAVLGPLFAPYDPTAIDVRARLGAPSASHLMGADELGRDLFSRTLYGARIALGVGLVAVSVATVIGVAIGIVAGFYRGWRDATLMRIVDVIFSFPPVLLALAIVAVLGRDIVNLVVALAIVFVPTFARVARASTLVITHEEYFEAARVVGAGQLRLMLRHVVPNSSGPLIVQFTVSLALAIVVEASLSFLGLGVQPPQASWGTMLSTGKLFLEVSPWPSLIPGAAILLTTLSFNLLGDGLRDGLDPRIRQAA